MLLIRILLGCLLLIGSTSVCAAGDGNRLAYLDGADPYYVSRDFAKLTTEQWIGEEGVQAVVVLAIDDMREPARYEAYLRPILTRLKQIDGRAPVSIMTNSIKPDDAQIQQWLDEGLSIEIHTIDHPCPLLQKGDFAQAKSTYDNCVDLMNSIPGNKPVAFRMPCCDSLNTVSPRFFAEIFNKTTPKGHFLSIDTSVFNVFTSDDEEIPHELVIDPNGKDKFKKYVPYDRSFVNTIENYPYPYVINRLCWEFPCLAPSDWSAQHLQQPNNPLTVRDLKAALDITVLKRGVLNLVFHPHGWIRNDQIVELIDHAVKAHGPKVKFLTFREAHQRLSENLLDGHPLRQIDGGDSGTRLLDINNDGFMDVIYIDDDPATSNPRQVTKRWLPETKTWRKEEWKLDSPSKSDTTLIRSRRYGIIDDSTRAVLFEQVSRDPNQAAGAAGSFELRRFGDSGKWELLREHPELRDELTAFFGNEHSGERESAPVVRAVRFRDIDADGRCELILCRPGSHRILRLSGEDNTWWALPFAFPDGVSLIDKTGGDAGLRFIDVDEDGYDDVIFSNAERYSIHLFDSLKNGWSREILAGRRGEKDAAAELPMIVRADGTNNGFFAHSRHLWWQNEHTAELPDLVDRRAYDDLLKNVTPGPKTPEASLKAMRPRPGFAVELVAAEPLVKDPVAFEWGADGKLWVVEMADYPVGMDGKGLPGGRVRYLEDTDNDGRYDESTLFLDKVPFPNGVMPWRKGVLVSAAPDIFYAEDTNGDGKADHREVLYTGFGEGNQQHRVNGFTWGLDNWIYCANGDSNGNIRSIKTGKTVNIRRRDFRIRPETGEIETELGSTQFGRSRDDWGNWFGNNNSFPMWQYVLEERYLRRNPHVPAPAGRRQVSETPGPSLCYPISRPQARFNDLHRLNRFTSACSAIVYCDELFGPEFSYNSFVSEPVHNLVHREVMRKEGLVFTSRRADDEQTSEFLASRDNWFRPTLLKVGPDGAMYVADMYRKVIEHTQYIPAELQKGLDVRAGDDRGRIYRIFPKRAELHPVPQLAELSTAELVESLNSSNAWQRDTAHRLLLNRHSPDAVPLLESLALTADRPKARLHALCVLDGLDALTPRVVNATLSDSHPGVRRRTIRLSERFLNNDPDVRDAVFKRLDDADEAVRLQLAYSLGECRDRRAGEVLLKLALKNSEQRYLVAAVISSVHEDNIGVVLTGVLSAASSYDPESKLVEQLFTLAATIGDDDVLGNVLASITTADDGAYANWQFEALADVFDALRRRDRSLEQLGQSTSRSLKTSLVRLAAVLDAARGIVTDAQADDSRRAAAIRTLARESPNNARDITRLADLLFPQTSRRVQAAAVTRLGELRDPEIASLLLERWKGLGPGLKTRVLDILASRDDWSVTLLDAVASGGVASSEIDVARRQRLLQHSAAAVRKRAEKLLTGSVDANRQRVLDAYAPALTLSGDAIRGKPLFAKHCATCHKLDGSGFVVGPDLAALKDKSPESLSIAILDPNRNVESKYINYVAVTEEGRTYSGILAGESGGSIDLLAPKGERVSILRSELEALTSTSQSTMPEGLEKEIKPQDLADVITYVRQAGRSRVPANQRGRFVHGVGPDQDGSLTLRATACEIYGDTIVLEEKYDNLGYWSSANDRAVWPIGVAQSGTYEVWLHWACDGSTAGNTLLIECGKAKLSHRVPSTESWNTYRRAKIGVMELASGSRRLTARPKGPVRGALIDLKSIRLVPAPKPNTQSTD